MFEERYFYQLIFLRPFPLKAAAPPIRPSGRMKEEKG